MAYFCFSFWWLLFLCKQYQQTTTITITISISKTPSLFRIDDRMELEKKQRIYRFHLDSFGWCVCVCAFDLRQLMQNQTGNIKRPPNRVHWNSLVLGSIKSTRYGVEVLVFVIRWCVFYLRRKSIEYQQSSKPLHMLILYTRSINSIYSIMYNVYVQFKVLLLLFLKSA